MQRRNHNEPNADRTFAAARRMFLHWVALGAIPPLSRPLPLSAMFPRRAGEGATRAPLKAIALRRCGAHRKRRSAAGGYCLVLDGSVFMGQAETSKSRFCLFSVFGVSSQWHKTSKSKQNQPARPAHWGNGEWRGGRLRAGLLGGLFGVCVGFGRVDVGGRGVGLGCGRGVCVCGGVLGVGFG